MKTTLAFALFSVFVLAPACHKQAAQPVADHPRLAANVRLQDVTFHSESLGRDMTYRVILPATISANVKLPALYLLHGGGGGYRDWLNYSDVSRYAARGVILVMPEGESSYYMNAVKRPTVRRKIMADEPRARPLHFKSDPRVPTHAIE